MKSETAAERVRAEIDDARLLKLFDYWLSKCPDGKLPARPDLDPLDLGFILGNLLLVDVERAPLRFRYRLIGTNLTAFIGFDLTGQAVDEHPDPNFRVAAVAIYTQIVETGAPLRFRRDAMIDDRLRRYQVLFLPLADDGHTVDMVLVGYSFDAGPWR